LGEEVLETGEAVDGCGRGRWKGLFRDLASEGNGDEVSDLREGKRRFGEEVGEFGECALGGRKEGEKEREEIGQGSVRG
jgi:hypothetical protein